MAAGRVADRHASDQLLAAFRRPGDDAPVELWVAYYDSQATGTSMHSPQACLPGGDWTIESLATHRLTGAGPDGGDLRVNRAVLRRGDVRQLVYYWFAERGRLLTSEFAVQWYIFWDGLTRNRTDGALVRVVTVVPDAARLPDADTRLADFVRDVDPQLAYHLPGRGARLRPAAGPD
jgi:EpsI family protein